jgi:beta-lactamase class D
MKRCRVTSLFYIFALTSACVALAAEPTPIDISTLFGAREGCFVLRELGGSELVQSGTLCEQAFSPCSTFKIPNAVIGLDSGVLESDRHLFKYDGKPRRRDTWNKDMDLREAMKVSCVPCFQEVARGIGAARMQAALDAFGYGNRDISGGIDRFWLSSTLTISPQQQVEFLAKLWSDTLPVKREAAEMVRRMLMQESGKGWQWAGKTGSCSVEDKRVLDHGWFVGEVEHDGRRAVFATFIRGEGAGGMEARPLARQALVELGWLPKEDAATESTAPAPRAPSK